MRMDLVRRRPNEELPRHHNRPRPRTLASVVQARATHDVRVCSTGFVKSVKK